MPTSDPTDEQAAREFKTTLREAVQSRERPPIELEWYESLLARIKASGRLLNLAATHSRVLFDHVRKEWNQAQTAEREREEQLNRAKAVPRDLKCLRSPDPGAWSGLGRRKQRCHAFNATGRAYTTRQRVSNPQDPTPVTPVPVFSVDRGTSPPLSVASTPSIPTRPPTPSGLREAAFGCVGLLASASGVNAYGHNTPHPMPRQPV
ncbi:hypothetical protein RhiJN_03100 [Ceratobasidium sp. AG-Ba]|nr:hypothetical protein RhiJN_03100 [Ceratobasidium sp. AG-Ba]